MTLSILLAGSSSLQAGVHENIMPDDRLYQRVKALGDAGYLELGDSKKLDEGKIVTRLELAFYIERAKTRMESPSLAPSPTPRPWTPPVPLAPLFQPTPVPDPLLPEPLPTTGEPTLPPPVQEPAPQPAPVIGPAAAQSEIEALLKELRTESLYLRTRMARDAQGLRDRTEELEKLKAVQDEVDLAFRRANKSSGSPNISSVTNLRVENLTLQGLVGGPTHAGVTFVEGTKVVNQVNVNFWNDLGGKGEMNLGLNGYLSSSNASAAPVSLSLSSPSVTYRLEGKLGSWSSTVMVEGYKGDTDLGTFVRGDDLSRQRYERPFEIKNYSSDKNLKTWEDYMTNLGYVASSVSWESQNNSYKVFSGIYMVGTKLPLVASDAKLTLLAGRTDQAYRWEEGIKYGQSWAGGLLNTNISSIWVNDNYGEPPANTAVLDIKTYALDMGLNIAPFYLQAEGSYSTYYTGVDLVNPADPATVEGTAVKASLNYGPFTLHYHRIEPGFQNLQSKVVMGDGVWGRFGYTPDGVPYGFVGTAETLSRNRQGIRANLGWKGRQQAWMQSWPSFLDAILVNFDYALQSEFAAVPDQQGYNSVEAYQFLSVYYPDDLGLWGNNFFGGWGGIAPGGQAMINNIISRRNDANWNGTGTVNNAYVMRFRDWSSQRVPLILLNTASGTPGGNTYDLLDHTKTFQHLTLTTKFQLNKLLGLSSPLYAGVFFTDHTVSGATDNPALIAMPDPNRPGEFLENIPDLFRQTVVDASLMVQPIKNINLMGTFGREYHWSKYTYPLLDRRIEVWGAGLAWDVPWGGGKMEARYKHMTFEDVQIPANDHTADQFYLYFLFQF